MQDDSAVSCTANKLVLATCLNIHLGILTPHHWIVVHPSGTCLRTSIGAFKVVLISYLFSSLFDHLFCYLFDKENEKESNK